MDPDSTDVADLEAGGTTPAAPATGAQPESSTEGADPSPTSEPEATSAESPLAEAVQPPAGEGWSRAVVPVENGSGEVLVGLDPGPNPNESFEVRGPQGSLLTISLGPAHVPGTTRVSVSGAPDETDLVDVWLRQT